MARRSSGGGGGGRSSYRPAAKSPPPRPRQPAAGAPAPAARTNRGGFMEAVADGIGFGAGDAAVHRAADAVVGPRTIQHKTVPAAAPADACSLQTKAFQDCLYSYMTDISNCQIYLDTWAACKRSHNSL